MEVAPAVDNSGSAKRRKVGNAELRLSSSRSVRITGLDGDDVINSSEKKELISGPCADETSCCSGDTPASCCSSDGSIMLKPTCVDLEEKAEIETTVRGNSDRIERFSLRTLNLLVNVHSLFYSSVRLKFKKKRINNCDLRYNFSLHHQINSQLLSPNFMAGYLTTPASESTVDSGELQPLKIDSRRTVPPEKTPPAAELEEFFSAAEKDLQNRFKDKYNYDIVNDVPLKGRFEWIQLKP
ncbi:hypothetical protein R6Q59_034785 [Mikania micrantha]